MDKLLPGAEPGNLNARQAQQKLADFAIAMAPLKATSGASAPLDDGFMLTERQLINNVINNFDKLDKDGNRFLSGTELESAASARTDNNASQADRDAARYLATNYYTIRSFHDDRPRGRGEDSRQDSFGLSRNDLGRFLDVTKSNFDPTKTAARETWDELKYGYAMTPVAGGAMWLFFKSLGANELGMCAGLTLGSTALYFGTHKLREHYVRKELVEAHGLSKKLTRAELKGQ